MKTKLTKTEIRKLKAKIRRELDIEQSVGVNRHHSIAADKKKATNKHLARQKVKTDDD